MPLAVALMCQHQQGQSTVSTHFHLSRLDPTLLTWQSPPNPVPRHTHTTPCTPRTLRPTSLMWQCAKSSREEDRPMLILRGRLVSAALPAPLAVMAAFSSAIC